MRHERESVPVPLEILRVEISLFGERGVERHQPIAVRQINRLALYLAEWTASRVMGFYFALHVDTQ
jgi:hypothetical protein